MLGLNRADFTPAVAPRDVENSPFPPEDRDRYRDVSTKAQGACQRRPAVRELEDYLNVDDLLIMLKAKAEAFPSEAPQRNRTWIRRIEDQWASRRRPVCRSTPPAGAGRSALSEVLEIEPCETARSAAKGVSKRRRSKCEAPAT